jgi:hypothetical protein
MIIAVRDSSALINQTSAAANPTTAAKRIRVLFVSGVMVRHLFPLETAFRAGRTFLHFAVPAASQLPGTVGPEMLECNLTVKAER